MHEEIIISGFGGQGIMFMGNMLAQAAMEDGKNVAGFPNYGAEMRGGESNYNLIISDKEIISPIIDSSTTLIIMNEPSLIKYETRLQSKGLLIINSSLVKKSPQKQDIIIIKLHATEIANNLGDVRTANMVALGAFAAKSRIISIDKLISTLSSLLIKKPELIQVNQQALQEGYELLR